jgi:hypothetical protein
MEVHAMTKSVRLAAIIGLLSATTVHAAHLDINPDMRLGGKPVTVHQIGVLRSGLKLSGDLGTPAAQLAEEPAEGRVSPALFGSFPATVHQAELGLAQPGSKE